MRLVSAVYGGNYYPFDALDVIDDCIYTEDPSELKAGDILVVWGGGDIHPSLYGHERSIMSQAGHQMSVRDRIEWNLMQQARTLGIPIIGVCRGAQMLCALDGGYLIQHATNHHGSHMVSTFDKNSFSTNSIHHQMMVPKLTTNKRVVAWTEPISDVYHIVNGEEQKLPKGWLPVEPEFIHFFDVNGYAIQWHPEMTSPNEYSQKYVLDYLNEHIK